MEVKSNSKKTVVITIKKCEWYDYYENVKNNEILDAYIIYRQWIYEKGKRIRAVSEKLRKSIKESDKKLT